MLYSQILNPEDVVTPTSDHPPSAAPARHPTSRSATWGFPPRSAWGSNPASPWTSPKTDEPHTEAGALGDHVPVPLRDGPIAEPRVCRVRIFLDPRPPERVVEGIVNASARRTVHDHEVLAAVARDQVADDSCRQFFAVSTSITGYKETHRHQKYDFVLRRLTGPLILRRNSDGPGSVLSLPYAVVRGHYSLGRPKHRSDAARRLPPSQAGPLARRGAAPDRPRLCPLASQNLAHCPAISGGGWVYLITRALTFYPADMWWETDLARWLHTQGWLSGSASSGVDP
jgi:hypothetical protein